MFKDQELYQKAKKLRKSGKSYSEITKALGIPKSTLSSWFSKKTWSQKINILLNKNWKKRNAKRLIKMNKAKKWQTIARHNGYREEAAKEFKMLKKDPLFLAGISIYWGEGEKAPRGRVGVINIDPNLLKVTANFFRKCLKIPEHQLRVALFIYKDHKQTKIINFWAEELKIPKTQFIKTQILPSRSRLTKRKVSNGICSLYFSNTKMYIKIMEWIRLLGIELRE